MRDDLAVQDDWIEYIVLSRRRVRAAAVEHRCGECRGSIHVGQPYIREAVLADGDFAYMKRHIHWTECEAANTKGSA